MNPNDEKTTTTNTSSAPFAELRATEQRLLPKLTPSERTLLRNLAGSILTGALEVNLASQRFARMAARIPGLWTALAVGASSSLAGIAAGLCTLGATAALVAAGTGDEDRPDEPFPAAAPEEPAPAHATEQADATANTNPGAAPAAT